MVYLEKGLGIVFKRLADFIVAHCFVPFLHLPDPDPQSREEPRDRGNRVRAMNQATKPCPACGGTHLSAIYRLEAIPVQSCVLLDTVFKETTADGWLLLCGRQKSCGSGMHGH